MTTTPIRLILFLALAVAPVQALSAATIEWMRQLGTAANDAGRRAAVDGSGSVYVSGYTLGDLGGLNAGLSDAFVAKYDATGALQWTRQLGTTAHDFSYDVAVDGMGSVYISGTTGGSLGGPSAGSSDGFLSKYDAAGALQWTRQLGTSEGAISWGVSADGLGNVYISGMTEGDLGGPNAGGSDAFVAKYNAAGNREWIRQWGTLEGEQSMGVAADGLGNVFITGLTEGDLAQPNAGLIDAFVAKYDAAGDLQWTRQLGTAGKDVGRAVAVDGLGSVYITGYTEGDLGGPNSGGSDTFLSKFDAAGDLQWTRQLGTSIYDGGNAVWADGAGNVVLAGVTWGNLFGPSVGSSDAFVAAYDASGTFQWGQQFGSPSAEFTRGVAAGGIGNVYISGETFGDLAGPSSTAVVLVFVVWRGLE